MSRDRKCHIVQVDGGSTTLCGINIGEAGAYWDLVSIGIERHRRPKCSGCGLPACKVCDEKAPLVLAKMRAAEARRTELSRS